MLRMSTLSFDTALYFLLTGKQERFWISIVNEFLSCQPEKSNFKYLSHIIAVLYNFSYCLGKMIWKRGGSRISLKSRQMLKITTCLTGFRTAAGASQAHFSCSGRRSKPPRPSLYTTAYQTQATGRPQRSRYTCHQATRPLP